MLRLCISSSSSSELSHLVRFSTYRQRRKATLALLDRLLVAISRAGSTSHCHTDGRGELLSEETGHCEGCVEWECVCETGGFNAAVCSACSFRIEVVAGVGKDAGLPGRLRREDDA